MKKMPFFIFFLLVVLIFSGFSQGAGVFSLSITPGGILPFPVSIKDQTNDYFSLSGGVGLSGEYILPFAPFIVTGVGLDYTLAPSNRTVTNSDLMFSLLSVSGKGGFIYEVIPNLLLGLSGSAGYYLAFGGDTAGSGPYFGGEAMISYNFSKSFGIGVIGAYSHYLSYNEGGPLFHGLEINLGARINFVGQGESKLEMKEIEFFPVFPVFYKYYDENPIGAVVVKNNEKGTIKDVKVSFYIKQYMDQPKLCATISELKDKEEKRVFIYALFTDNVLGITEGTKVLADIQTEYRYRDEKQEGKLVESIKIQNRNALTWDDDNKAGAFVTAKDPAILRFAKNIAGASREKGLKTINANFRYAFALFEALKIYNVNYVIDPTTPFAEYSKQKVAIDFLQFPRQTLEYKAGDCDDLSILFCGLLEAIGIETAFITIPGHIFMAFSTDLNESRGKTLFQNPGDLIFHEDKTWVPVEITMIQDGFLKAWKTGAKEWRDGAAKNAARILPVHEAWKLYEPVGYAKDDKEIPEPDYNKMTEQYVKELQKFVDNELETQVNELSAKIKESKNPEMLINKLGILYAKYGLLDKAEKEFLKIVDSKEGFSALINLANIYYLRKNYQKAIDYYELANKKEPDSPFTLIGLAKANYELEKYDVVDTLYKALLEVNKEFADKYAYLSSRDVDTKRAFSQDIKEEVEWGD